MAENKQCQPSYIRLLHGSPDAPPVDVYANNKLLASMLPFKNLTDYLRVQPGDYHIEIYPSSSIEPRGEPVLSKSLTVPPDGIFTVAVVGKVENINLIVISDPQTIPEKNTSYIRMVHLSPNAGSVGATIDNISLFSNVRFTDITNYIPVKARTYEFLSICGTDGQAWVLPTKNVVLRTDFHYTIYLLGLLYEQPELQIIITIDGLYQLSSL